MESIVYTLTSYELYLPLGIIGAWRWGVWIFKEIVGLFYKPYTNTYNATVSIITPVYNETPHVFRKALASWQENEPDEIIAVIDYSDTTCIAIFKEFAHFHPNAKLIVTQKPGKRPALADGIAAAKSEIVALVDSDTIWEKDVKKQSLAPFSDPLVGGVSTRQNVLHPKTFAQKAFDTQLDLRYADEMPYLDAIGDVLICLSGRTAFYRRAVVAPMLHDLVHETFMGEDVISGDDKRLTYLVQAAGWKTAYQKYAQVYTPGEPSIKTYMNQRLRWTRNSLRADLKAMYEGWVWKHPGLAFFQIDKVLQSGTTLLSPIYLIVALTQEDWIPAITIAIWWLVSRGIKLIPHFRRRPTDIIILPSFIMFTFASAVMRIYALFTLNTQGWITRWDASRLNQLRFLQKVPAYIATIAIIFALLLIVATQDETIASGDTIIASNRLIETSTFYLPPQPSQIGSSLDDHYFTSYTTQAGDSVDSIAALFNTTPAYILQANNQFIPNASAITPGHKLTVPTSLPFDAPINYRSDLNRNIPLDISFNEEDDAIMVSGRGNVVSFAQLVALVADYNAFEQITNDTFLQKENIHIGPGVTLYIEQQDVTTLRLLSSPEKFVWLRTYNGAIHFNGVTATSWDPSNNTFDENLDDGRSFIVAKYAGRMDVINSEIAYLGFKPEPGRVYPPKQDASPYGISWKIPEENYGNYLMTGIVRNSSFHHNYFGAYTFGATGMIWEHNNFHNNIRYGLDPHDDSNYAFISDNRFYENGSHGLILSKRCINNTIVHNYSYNNAINGIMLHADSNFNTVQHNTIRDNSEGIVIYDSHTNLISSNYVMTNDIGIRLNKASAKNSIQNNTVTTNSSHGIYAYGNAAFNQIIANTIRHNIRGVYFKDAHENFVHDNSFQFNHTAIYLDYRSETNTFSENNIRAQDTYAIYAQPELTQDGKLLKNITYGNTITQ